jgi:hypothetical protein
MLSVEAFQASRTLVWVVAATWRPCGTDGGCVSEHPSVEPVTVAPARLDALPAAS